MSESDSHLSPVTLSQVSAQVTSFSNTSGAMMGHTLTLSVPILHPTSANLSATSTLPGSVKDFVFYSEAVVQPVILGFGLVFNLINFVVLRRSEIAPMFQLCLLALTFSDIFVCLFGISQLLVEGIVFRGEIPFGYWHGAALASHLLYYAFLTMLCTSAIYVLVVASVRARMISQPYKITDTRQLNCVKYVLILGFWSTLALFLPSIIYAVWQVCYNETDNARCEDFFKKLPNAGSMHYYFYVISVLFGPCVSVANMICIIVIKTALRRSVQRLEKLKLATRRSQQSQRITFMLLIILVLDTLWTMPSNVHYLGLAVSPQKTIFNKQNSAYVIYDVIAEILLLFKPTYNIFVYLATNTEYRFQFMKIFCQRRAVKSQLSSIGSAGSSPAHTPKRLSKAEASRSESLGQTGSSKTGEKGGEKMMKEGQQNGHTEGLLDHVDSEQICPQVDQVDPYTMTSGGLQKQMGDCTTNGDIV